MSGSSRRKAYAAGRDGRPRPARGMALDVYRHRVLRDVGGGDFDMNREAGGAAAEALRADAELVHRAGQFLLDFGALFVGADRAERPGRRDLGKVHAEVGGTADADAD